ncbi:MAG: hypothetical protein WAU95_18490, partial [Anaerolineae bacterium]
HRTTLAPLVVPYYQGQRGNPVLFDRRTFGDLLAVTGDVGGRPLLHTYANELSIVACKQPAPRDIDTAADLEMPPSPTPLAGGTDRMMRSIT